MRVCGSLRRKVDGSAVGFVLPGVVLPGVVLPGVVLPGVGGRKGGLRCC